MIGPSGAGKSTLLSAIAGFLTPAEGRILWQGQDLVAVPPGDRPVTILFQDQNLFPHLTIAQNLGLGVRPDLRLSPADHARIEAALARIGLAGLGPRRPAQLSGGQASRAALARALLRARPILLAGRALRRPWPGSAGRDAGIWCARWPSETGAMVLMVTHDPDDAIALGGETCFVADGVAQPPVETRQLVRRTRRRLARLSGPG